MCRIVREWAEGGTKHIRSAAAIRHCALCKAPRKTSRARSPCTLHRSMRPGPSRAMDYSELQLREALRTVGKYAAEDELNCGGCGYDSCRDFAHALIAGNAERMMCATYTRKLAQKKANALLQRMPSAVVIVNEDLKIIECNSNFVRQFAGGIEPQGNLEGNTLGDVLPFFHLFRRVLESGEDIVGHGHPLSTQHSEREHLHHRTAFGDRRHLSGHYGAELPERTDHRPCARSDPEEPEDRAADSVSARRECRRLGDYF